MPPHSLVIDIKDTLCFFDEIPDWSKGHATAIVGVLGEDLSAAALKHCLEQNGAQHVQIRPGPVKNPGRKGPWLDRWVAADLPGDRKVLFQTEIKSWSAHAIGGKILRLDATNDDIANLQRKTWEEQWDSSKQTLKHQYVAKVLVRMSPPSDMKDWDPFPMIIYWTVVDPRVSSSAEKIGEGNHLFRIKKVTYEFPFRQPESWDCSHKFEELWVFSVSSYLRFLLGKGCREIKLPMPDAVGRLRSLGRLAKTVGD